MLHRIKQFYRAMTVKITQEDMEFLNLHLNRGEKQLFLAMDEACQLHSLKVAAKCFQDAQNQKDLSPDLLVKVALLHDVGKKAGTLPTFFKVLLVIGDSICPQRMKSIASERNQPGFWGTLCQASYVYYHHPALSAELAAGCDVEDEVIELIKIHHQKSSCCSNNALEILQNADEEN